MAMYLEAVTIPGPEGDFDPKFKQKKVYRWYDARYSDEALDIYSTEWRDRIVSWHEHAAPLPAAELSVEQLLEQLEFGSFFLAHPIAAFSLWQVLQTCYELDRAVCGVTDEVVSWQKIPPFQYFRDSRIQARWRESLKQLKERIRKRDPSPSGESAEYKMYEIRLGVEKFESAFEALKENFSINLRDMKFALWMIDRIDNDIGKRFAMITDILDFKDEDHIRPIDSSDGDNSGTHQSHSPQEGLKQINKKSEQRQTASKPKSSKRLTTTIKSGFGALKNRIQKPKISKKLGNKR